MYHPFSVVETTRTAWTIFKKNFVTIIVYSCISVALLSFLKFLAEFLAPISFTYEMITSFVLVFAQAYTTLGLYKLIFTLIDSEYYEFEFRQVLPAFKNILSYLGIFSFIVLMIFGFSKVMETLNDYPNLQELIQQITVLIALYLGLRVMFFVTYIVDDQSGGFESLVQSYNLTKGYFFKVLIMLLIILLFIALPAFLSQYPGLGFLWIGIIFTYPFVNIILAVTYRKLIYSHQDVDDDIAETN
jgi:hypothetical protein